LEVKGYETERDQEKEAAARRWVKAVNHYGVRMVGVVGV